MRLVLFAIAGAGGRDVALNPEQVVCVLSAGDRRSQVVTTGLTDQTAMTLIVEGTVQEVTRKLVAAQEPALA